jgi:SAM-dependent methyltransferase
MTDERDQLTLFRTASISPNQPDDLTDGDPLLQDDLPNRSSMAEILHDLGVGDDDPVPEGHIGELHQLWLESRGARKVLGSFYTPTDIVSGLVDLTLGPILQAREALGADAVAGIRVIDPACGSGNFLVAVARRIEQSLTGLGMDQATARHHAFGRCVIGIDIDREAIEICRLLLVREARGSVTRDDVEARILVTDALTVPLHSGSPLLDDSEPVIPDWPHLLEFLESPSGFDLVIGNPPFLSQLSHETARNKEYASELSRRFGSAASGFVDPAALFLLLASEIADHNRGVVTLIQPISTMSTRDARSVRQTVLSKGAMSSIWIADQRVFDAAVDVYAPVLTLGSDLKCTDILVGREFRSAGSDRAPGPEEHTWSSLLATSRGIPRHELRTSGQIGDIANATADFRDQYYGLAPHVLDLHDADSDQRPPLVTTGLIDPAHCQWGERPIKFNKQSYQFPRVELVDLPEKLGVWAKSRLVPKVLLATQTRVLEAMVDPAGEFLPSVPVVTITSDQEDLWNLAALLVSPPVTLIALRRHLGAALSADALKLGARDVLALPLPEDRDPWVRAGVEFRTASESVTGEARRSHLIESGRLMCKAYRASDAEALVEWWLHRLPKVRYAT